MVLQDVGLQALGLEPVYDVADITRNSFKLADSIVLLEISDILLFYYTVATSSGYAG